jgi:hypothetical protein
MDLFRTNPMAIAFKYDNESMGSSKQAILWIAEHLLTTQESPLPMS